MTVIDFYNKWKSTFTFSKDKTHLFIIRGLPGSGKSTFCDLLRKDYGMLVLEPDSFITKAGEYTYSKEKFEEAVFTCSWIIYNNIDNMDICYCDVLPKINDVRRLTLLLESTPNIRIVVIDMPKISKNTSMKRNIHEVRECDIDNMLELWEDWKTE